MKVHLVSGAGGVFGRRYPDDARRHFERATACVAQPRRSKCFETTDKPELVTCDECRRSHDFQTFVRGAA